MGYLEREEREEIERMERLVDKPLYNIPQTVQVYRNRNAGTLYYIFTGIFLVLAIGSIAIIPVAVELASQGVVTIILTITFWIGFIGSIQSIVGINAYERERYLLTDQKLLYRVYFWPRQYGDGEVAYTQLGSFIQNTKIINERCKVHEAQEKYLSSDNFQSIITKVVNGEGQLTKGCTLCKLNSASISKRCMDGVKIRYWDEDSFRWQEVKLRKTNEGYQEIVELLRSRSRKYTLTKKYM